MAFSLAKICCKIPVEPIDALDLVQEPCIHEKPLFSDRGSVFLWSDSCIQPRS